MTFKIVQTLERGGYRLSVVPSLWESNNVLRWPPKHQNILRLIKDELSKPGTDWDKMKCNVKRKQLSSYVQAEVELECMERQSETDGNNEPQCPPHNNIQAQDLQTFDFEAYADTLANTDSQSKNINNVNTGEVFLQVCGDQNIITEKLDTIMNMIQNQYQIIENMANKICVMSVQIEDITEKLSRYHQQPIETVTLLKNAKNQPDNQSFSFEIIENRRQLDALEVTLADKGKYKTLKHHLSFLCSPAVGGGKTFAYRLLDAMLSRNFVPLCSWSGGSRGETSKIALKDYKLFIKFFFDSVRSWDTTFTIECTENFFKAALKNSMKRKSMKDLRASRTKRHRTLAKKSHESKIRDRQDEDTSNIEQEQNKRNNEEDEATENINMTQELPLNGQTSTSDSQS